VTRLDVNDWGLHMNSTSIGFTFLAFLPALISMGLLVFILVMFTRLVRAAEGAREALRDLADRFPNMGGGPST
jgi:hypothetical protein